MIFFLGVVNVRIVISNKNIRTLRGSEIIDRMAKLNLI